MRMKTDSYCSDLKCLLSDRLRAGSWLPLWLPDLEKLSPRQAILLGIVLNLSKERADADGWILLTPAYLHNGPLHLSNTKQEELLRALGRLGLLTVSWKGRRRVRINLTNLKRLADGRLTEDEDDGFDY
jgi:hypothetical protein